jgi:transposase-like protein
MMFTGDGKGWDVESAEVHPEYRAEAVALVIDSGRRVSDVAKSLGINETTLANWVNRAKERGDVPDKPLTTADRAELERLRKENAQLQMDNLQLGIRAGAVYGDVVSLLAAKDAEIAALLGRVRELEGLVAALQAQLGRDSSNSGKPPSSDSPFTKKPAPRRSVRRKSGKPRGRQLGAPGATLRLIEPAKKGAAVTNPSSRGAELKETENGTASLDQWQKAAAIESPEGPQRIRGLAGSGKTVVLSP